MFSSFVKNSYKLSLLGIAIILLLGGCIFINAKIDKPIHQPIAIEDVVSVKQWGNSTPNGEERIETDEGTTKIVHWFNAISDIRENKNFEGSTPEAGIIIEMKSGERILILRSGDQFEIQRKGISYWGKQREMNILLEKLASKPPEKQPQQQSPIKTEIIEGIGDWRGYRTIKFTNGWVKALNGELGGESITVAAGAYRNDPEQGVLQVIVHGHGKESAKSINGQYQTPEKHGTIKIEGFVGFLLSLEAEDGTRWVFDVLTRQFQKNDHQTAETQKESEIVVAPIRPQTKTDVIQIEGTDQEFSFYLYKSLGFSTYIPEDMVVEAEHHSINIFPNYVGEINRNAVLKIFARNTDTVEKMALLIEDDLVSKGFTVKPSQDNIFSFSEQEFDIESPLYGGASVFKHNEIIYGLIFYYTGEMGDGFHPRIMKIIDEIVWDDEATNENSNITYTHLPLLLFPSQLSWRVK